MVSVLSGPRVSISIIDCHTEETLSPASVLQTLGQLSYLSLYTFSHFHMHVVVMRVYGCLYIVALLSSLV